MPTATTLAEKFGSGDLRGDLIEAGRRLSTGQHRLVRLCAAVDRSHCWAVDGATSSGRWIAELLDVEACTAREWVRIGRALERLRFVDSAFAEGRVSYSKVRVLTRVATPGTEAELVALSESVAAGQLNRAIAAWRAAHESPADTDDRQQRDRTFSTWVDADGMVCGHFRLPPLEGGTLIAGVEAELMRHRPEPTGGGSRARSDASADASGLDADSVPHCAPLSAQRADALVRLLTARTGSTDYEVILHVRGDGCTLHDGTPIPASVVERIAPTAFLRAMVHDAENDPVGVSHRRRHPTTREKRLIDERQPVCPDCGGTSLLEYDHVPPYHQTGHTRVDELDHPCAPCHRRRHGNGRASRR